MSKVVADALSRDSIRVNVVCPSRIKIALTADLDTDEEVCLGRNLELQESRWGGAIVPLGRRDRPENNADAVVFMASERAGYICGANIDVDGGHQRMIFR